MLFLQLLKIAGLFFYNIALVLLGLVVPKRIHHVQSNHNITDAWYRWTKKTVHQIIPGDFIAGYVCVIQKVQDDAA